MKQLVLTIDLDEQHYGRMLSNADFAAMFKQISISTLNGRIDGPVWDQFGDKLGTFTMAEGE